MTKSANNRSQKKKGVRKRGTEGRQPLRPSGLDSEAGTPLVPSAEEEGSRENQGGAISADPREPGGMQQEVDPSQPTLTVVEAQAFVLRDRKGNMRAALGPTKEGNATLTFFDEDGTPRMDVGLEDDFGGSPLVGLRDETGKPQAILRLTPDGRARMGLYGEMNSGIVLECHEQGDSSITINDLGGDDRVVLSFLHSPDMPGLEMRDHNGNSCVDLWHDRANGPCLRLSHHTNPSSADLVPGHLYLSGKKYDLAIPEVGAKPKPGKTDKAKEKGANSRPKEKRRNRQRTR